MLVYYITFVLVILLGAKAEKQYNSRGANHFIYIKEKEDNSAIYVLAIGCILVFVAGFRYKVGSDYSAYYYQYSDYIADLKYSIPSFNEPGFGILAWIATRFVDDGAAAIFIASLVTISLSLFVIYKNSDSLLLTIVFYITLGCWHGSFNGVRQYLAASIVFCGYGFIRDRQLFKYLMVIFVAFLFHKSALVMLLVYYFVNRDISVKNTLVDVFAIAVLLMAFEKLFSVAGWIMEKDYSMKDSYAATEVNRIRVLSACIPAIIFLIAYMGKELTRLETMCLNITILNAAFCLITMNSALLYRIGIYMSSFQAIAIPQLLKRLSDNNRKIITAGFLIMYTGMWWYELFTYKSYNNFQWIWQR